MANPAILIGLLAGYTVGAVVTALAVAHDEPPRRFATLPINDPSSAAGVRARVIHADRRIPRCLRSLDRSRQLSSPRR